jgi:hypothetical protein
MSGVNASAKSGEDIHVARKSANATTRLEALAVCLEKSELESLKRSTISVKSPGFCRAYEPY